MPCWRAAPGTGFRVQHGEQLTGDQTRGNERCDHPPAAMSAGPSLAAAVRVQDFISKRCVERGQGGLF